MTQNNDQFVPPAPGAQLPPPPSEVLDGITFNDQPSVTKEPKPVETPKESPATPEKTTPTAPEIKAGEDAVLPSRYESESDVQYNLRTQLFIAGQAKAKAETPEEKSILAKHMKELRGELAKVNKVDEPLPPTPPSKPNSAPAPADDREAIANSLRELGFKPGDEITKEAEQIARKIVEDRFNAEQQIIRRNEQTQAINEFYNLRTDISLDDNKRDVLENYVLEMFKPQLPNMNKAQLMQALDMAANYLFPKDALNRKIESAQDKTDKLNIHGAQGGDIKPSTVSDKSKAELRALGWSDADIESFEKKK